MTKLTMVEGIGEQYAQQLLDAGIETTEVLLERGATSQGRQELAETTGISDKLILKWANRVDLFRVKGIGEEYADLLEVAGVDTVPDLARRNPTNLHEKLKSVNAEKKLVRRVPTLAAVESWVAQAKELPRKLTY
jgi:predicted flap endonuclease-1-like 5' DNA nuclease